MTDKLLAVEDDEAPCPLFTTGNTKGVFDVDDLGVSAAGVVQSSSPCESGIFSTRSFRKSNRCSARMHCFLKKKSEEHLLKDFCKLLPRNLKCTFENLQMGWSQRFGIPCHCYNFCLLQERLDK